MRSTWRLSLAIVFVLAACESDRGPGGEPDRGDSGPGVDVARSDAAADSGMPQGDAGAEDTGLVGGLIPVPPNTPADLWIDTEPNDTPSQAVPVGILAGALWLGFGASSSRIASNGDTDFYVFRTGDTTSLMRLPPMQICADD